MIQRYRQGQVPATVADDAGNAPAPSAGGACDADLKATARQTIAVYGERMERLGLHEALEAVWDLVTRANRYVEENAPWKLAKDEGQAGRLDTVLYHLAESVRLISVLIQPVMPEISRRIRIQLGQGDEMPSLEELAWGRLPAGTMIQKPTPLFPKHETR